ncbi:hypothetical protein ACFQY0_04395 [Haloferula chungangensis]|uniref:Outer membrane protein beta-barrel domain-containing protein n=1 Tax=Haloferula chungangensis TaxID=1048331 RepID=A0ABW2L4J1_9BACT
MTSRLTIFALLTLPALAGDPPSDAKSPIIPAPESRSSWRIGAGAMWRNIGELSVNPNLQNGPFANRFFIPPTGAGPENAYADRTYDDGYVNIGAATAASGMTTNWGYQNGSQVSGGSLNYTLSGGRATSLPSFSHDDSDSVVAPYLELSYLRPVQPNLFAGFTANLAIAGLDGQTASTMTSSPVSIVDSYALGGVIPPTAPYSGDYFGPGPLINNQPTNRTLVQGTPVAGGSYLFGHDTDLYSLALGGELEWHPAESCYIGFGAGAVLNLADWSASWSAPIPNANAIGSTTVIGANSDQEFLWGLYLKASAGYQITEQWSVEGFLRYDWNQALEGVVSPTAFELDLTGLSVGIGVGYRF